ncbi:hypothetical protein SDC9_187558 [bioreactor metagenome]|uniref:Uncharacterized protein n=1 Tax=bioreactor metagenome TaxID=1076179 RepID=A0A645HXH4_9ZZZZ
MSSCRANLLFSLNLKIWEQVERVILGISNVPELFRRRIVQGQKLRFLRVEIIADMRQLRDQVPRIPVARLVGNYA